VDGGGGILPELLGFGIGIGIGSGRIPEETETHSICMANIITKKQKMQFSIAYFWAI